MASSDIPAIDVHGHYGDFLAPHRDPFLSGDASVVVQRARQVNIETTVVSPLSALVPRGKANSVLGNIEAAETVAATDGLLQWVVINPHQPETYRQAAEMLYQPKCVGIKIHPEEHIYPISEYGDAIFEFAARHDAVIMAHSGDGNSLPLDFVPFANAYPNVTLILAHLGNGGAAGGDPSLQVEAIQASARGNVYVDTSSARSIMPGLVEWAVREIGADRILFGTDTPLYFTAMQRIRIDCALISDTDKKLILRDNAERILAASLLKTEQPAC